MTAATRHDFSGRDGVPLVWHELGPADGRPLVLIHGLFSDARTNWIKYGHAALLAGAGHRVIMPDLRAHGESGRPHDPAAYPPDILADDAAALLDRLGLAAGAFDLGGYSLGGRTVVRMLVGGVRPRRAAIAGMGLQGLIDPEARAAVFRGVLSGLGTHPRGSAAFMAEAFLKANRGDPAALMPLLGSFVPTDPKSLGELRLPVLVVAGIDDQDNGSAEALAAALPDGHFRTIPGNHMSAVVQQALGQSLLGFFG